MSLKLSATYIIQTQTTLLILNLAFEKAGAATSVSTNEAGRAPQRSDDQAEAKTSVLPGTIKTYPLGMVLEACPDIADYAKEGINSWRDLIATAGLARAALGISADAWREAQETMGATDAAVMIAAILQKGEAIGSPGGYLRALSAKARAKEFSIGPVLMALLRGKLGKGGRHAAG